MPDGVYETDALAWAEHQAALLRRLAAGERMGEVDWNHVIEEVQDLGLSELRACRSLLRQALVHLLKRSGGDAVGFLVDAKDRLTPSMRQRIDIQDIYASAVIEVEAGAEPDEAVSTFLKDCPLSLDDLLAGRPDIGALVAKL
jgi:hypothetical protein